MIFDDFLRCRCFYLSILSGHTSEMVDLLHYYFSLLFAQTQISFHGKPATVIANGVRTTTTIDPAASSCMDQQNTKCSFVKLTSHVLRNQSNPV